MKIIYLHQFFVTPSEAGGTRSYEFARRLVASGHEVHMITSSRTADALFGWATEELEGFQVHRLSVTYDNKMSYLRRMWAFACFALGATLKAIRLAKGADVIFATSTPLSIAVPGIVSSAIRRVPMVFEVRDVWPELPIAVGALKNPILIALARSLEGFAYRHSRHVVALSPGMRDSIVRSGIKAEKVSIITNGCDLAEFSPEGDKFDLSELKEGLNEFPVVLYTGTIGIINGCDYLVEVAFEAKRLGHDTRFLIIGDGHEAARIRALAEQKKVLGETLFMHPPVAKVAIPALMRRADLSISMFIDLPAMWANSANKFFDTLSSGTPIAINYGGWQSELIAQERIGLVLCPHNYALAATQISEFLADYHAVKNAGRNARKLARERFSRDRLASELEAVLKAAAR